MLLTSALESPAHGPAYAATLWRTFGPAILAASKEETEIETQSYQIDAFNHSVEVLGIECLTGRVHTSFKLSSYHCCCFHCPVILICFLVFLLSHFSHFSHSLSSFLLCFHNLLLFLRCALVCVRSLPVTILTSICM